MRFRKDELIIMGCRGVVPTVAATLFFPGVVITRWRVRNLSRVNNKRTPYNTCIKPEKIFSVQSHFQLLNSIISVHF